MVYTAVFLLNQIHYCEEITALIIALKMKNNRNALVIVCSRTISGSKMAASSITQFDFLLLVRYTMTKL